MISMVNTFRIHFENKTPVIFKWYSFQESSFRTVLKILCSKIVNSKICWDILMENWFLDQ